MPTENSESREQLQKRAAELGVNPKDLVGSTKPPVALVPPCLEIYAAMAMKNGAIKYGPYNWRDQKIAVMEYLSAMKRHIDAFIDREENATDSSIHHLAHVAAGCGIVLDAFLNGCVHDDRPKKGNVAALIEKFTETKSASEYPKYFVGLLGSIWRARHKGDIGQFWSGGWCNSICPPSAEEHCCGLNGYEQITAQRAKELGADTTL